jgi:hypothetical protein
MKGRKDGTAKEEGMFGGHDHDTFPAFMHSTENTTGVGACVHAQYWRMIRHSRTIDTHTHHWQREWGPRMFSFGLLIFGRFGEIWGDFAEFGCWVGLLWTDTLIPLYRIASNE